MMDPKVDEHPELFWRGLLSQLALVGGGLLIVALIFYFALVRRENQPVTLLAASGAITQWCMRVFYSSDPQRSRPNQDDARTVEEMIPLGQTSL